MRSLLEGAGAGTFATLIMTAGMFAARAGGLLGEPPPKKLTRRLMTVLGHRPGTIELHAATAGAHLAYGAGAGALYAILPGRVRGPVTGAAFGVALWAASYMGWIPKLGLMRRPSRDRTGRPTAMILMHIVYGVSLDQSLRDLGRRALPRPDAVAAVPARELRGTTMTDSMEARV